MSAKIARYKPSTVSPPRGFKLTETNSVSLIPQEGFWRVLDYRKPVCPLTMHPSSLKNSLLSVYVILHLCENELLCSSVKLGDVSSLRARLFTP